MSRRPKSDAASARVGDRAKCGARLAAFDRRTSGTWRGRIYARHRQASERDAKKNASRLHPFRERSHRCANWLSQIDKDTKEARDQADLRPVAGLLDAGGDRRRPLDAIDRPSELRDQENTADRQDLPNPIKLPPRTPPTSIRRSTTSGSSRPRRAGSGHLSATARSAGSTTCSISTRSRSTLWSIRSPAAVRRSTSARSAFGGTGRATASLTVERETDIRLHDMTDGLPPLPRWKDVRLVYLDPPYWKQAEGQYSKDPADFANMTLAKFNERLSRHDRRLRQEAHGRRSDRAHHPADAMERAGSRGNRSRRRHDPTREAAGRDAILGSLREPAINAQMVDWAKANKRCLVLTREIVVWRVA